MSNINKNRDRYIKRRNLKSDYANFTNEDGNLEEVQLAANSTRPISRLLRGDNGTSETTDLEAPSQFQEDNLDTHQNVAFFGDHDFHAGGEQYDESDEGGEGGYHERDLYISEDVHDDEDDDGDDGDDGEDDEVDGEDDELISGYWSEELEDRDESHRSAHPSRGSTLLRNLMQQERLELSDSNLLDVMQRIVGGMSGDTSFARPNSEYDHLIDNLNQREDSYLVLETLNELLERLLMMNGFTAERVVPAGKLAKSLILILNDPRFIDELELHLVACRCLYNFIEVNQDFIHHALNNNVMEALVQRVSEITYIDLTEQALQTLEAISREPRAHLLIVESNGLQACLQNLDFLTIHAQRKCLIIFANACTNISTERFSLVEAAFPLLFQVVKNYKDSLVIEYAWLAISRIISSYKHESEYIERLFENEELLKQMVLIITKSCNSSTTENGLNQRSTLSLMKSLNILSIVSIRISNILLNLDIGSEICHSLNRYKKTDESSQKLKNLDSTISSKSFENMVPIEAVIAAPKDFLFQFLQLIDSILPIPPSFDYTLFLEKVPTESASLSYDEKISVFTFGKFWGFVNTIWPVLIHSFQGSMDIDVRRKVLLAMYKIVYFADESVLTLIEGFNLLSGIVVSVIASERKLVDAQYLSKGNDGVNVLKQNLMVFSVFLILKTMMEKSSIGFLRLLEKDGLFEDLFAILDGLLQSYEHDQEEDTSKNPDDQISSEDIHPRSHRVSFSSSSSAHYFANSTVSSLQKSYKNIVDVGAQLKALYDDFKDKNGVLQETGNEIANLIRRLSSVSDSSLNAEWDDIWSTLKNMLDSNKNGVSSFELTSLGILDILINLLGENGSSVSTSPCKSSFVKIFYTNNESISRFVSLLEDSISRRETFDVYTSGGSIGGDSWNNTASMAKQIKLRLVPKVIDDSLHNQRMQQKYISVHSVATFRTIEEFLEQRFDLAKKLDEQDLPVKPPLGSSDAEMVENNENHSTRRIHFFLNCEAIPYETTVFGAVFKGIQNEKKVGKVDPYDVWSKQHTIFYGYTDSETHKEENEPFYEERDSEFCDKATNSVFLLLKVLFELNNEVKRLHEYTSLPPEKFRNWKLTVKLNRQLEELLIVASGTLPNWCMRLTKDFPFILPLESKILFLQSTSFGYSRLIHNWQLRSARESSDDSSRRSAEGISLIGAQVGRPSRIKARISREQFFPSAMKVLLVYGTSPEVLEIEYFNEVGSGLGPTLEFYSTTSREFCRKELHMWRDDPFISDNDTNGNPYVFNSSGLFPAPLDPRKIGTENGRKILFLFSQLGKFVARALLDSRIVDFEFNPLFLCMVRNSEMFEGDLNDSERKYPDKLSSALELVDPKLAKSLEQLKSLLSRVELKGNHYDQIEELSLCFVLPGYSNYELIPNGANISVTSENIDQYIEKVIDASVFSGVFEQMKSFVKGFSEVFPISALSIFTTDELNEVFGSSHEDWSRDALSEAIKPNHGYNHDSIAIERLINVLVNFSGKERRKFLQFLTGSPKLPIGGFKAMRPEFTVVRKYAEDNFISDDYLPSVMTCANYLKLPDYSLEEIMHQKLIDAITEGANAFHLS